jgi:hypothetical protein
MLDPEAEDVAFALEPVKGVVAVLRVVPPGPKARYVVELEPEHAAYAKAHASMRFRRLGLEHVAVELLAWGTPPTWVGRLEPVVLDDRARERARARALVAETRRTDEGCYVPRPELFQRYSYGEPGSSSDVDARGETLVLGPLQLAAASQHWFGPTRHVMQHVAAERALRSDKYLRVLVDMTSFGYLLHEEHLFRRMVVLLVATREDVPIAERAARALPTRARILVRPLERQRPPYGPFAPVTEHEHVQAEIPVLLHDPTGVEEVPTAPRATFVVTRTLAGALRTLARNDFAEVIVDATSRTDGRLDYRAIWEHAPSVKARTRLLVSEAQRDALLARNPAGGADLRILVRPLRVAEVVSTAISRRRALAACCSSTSSCPSDPRGATMRPPRDSRRIPGE